MQLTYTSKQYLGCINRYAIILMIYIISTDEIHAVTDKIEWNFTCLFVCLMVFNATFNNISVISWRSILLAEETGRAGGNHRPVASH